MERFRKDIWYYCLSPQLIFSVHIMKATERLLEVLTSVAREIILPIKHRVIICPIASGTSDYATTTV